MSYSSASSSSSGFFPVAPNPYYNQNQRLTSTTTIPGQFQDISAEDLLSAGRPTERPSGVTIVYPAASNLPSVPTRSDLASGNLPAAPAPVPVKTLTQGYVPPPLSEIIPRKIVNSVERKNKRDYYPVESTMFPIRCSCGFVFRTRDQTKRFVALEEAVEMDLKAGKRIDEILNANAIVRICCRSKVIETPFVTQLIKESEKRVDIRKLTLTSTGPETSRPLGEPLLLQSTAGSMKIRATNDTSMIEYPKPELSIVDEEGNIIADREGEEEDDDREGEGEDY